MQFTLNKLKLVTEIDNVSVELRCTYKDLNFGLALIGTQCRIIYSSLLTTMVKKRERINNRNTRKENFKNLTKLKTAECATTVLRDVYLHVHTASSHGLFNFVMDLIGSVCYTRAWNEYKKYFWQSSPCSYR